MLPSQTLGQDKGLQVDLLSRYYTQDGDHSAVTGGEGTEELDAVGPIILVQYETSTRWIYNAELGLENVTSASLDRIDYFESAPGVNVSSASRKDNRVHINLGATKQMDRQTLGATVGFSGEYDYRSINAGLNGSWDWNAKMTTLSGKIHFYSDTLDRIDIYGFNEGEADRETLDLGLSLTQVINRNMVLDIELARSDQSGFLSAPFNEVHLQNGTILAEQLPDQRIRDAIKLQLNVALSPRVVQRSYARYYTDDWDIKSTTLELETHFKLKWKGENWIYPFIRYYDQTGSTFFGKRHSFSGDESYFSSDWDLSTFDSFKYGFGFRKDMQKKGLSRWSIRLSYYDRSDGLNSISVSGGMGWSF